MVATLNIHKLRNLLLSHWPPGVSLGKPQLLVAAPLGIAIDRRHMAARCAWCFAMREADEGGAEEEEPEGIEWQLCCEACRSCYYCSEACRAAAAPRHALECAALRAVDEQKRLKKEERALARLLISILATAQCPPAPGESPARTPTLSMLLELCPDQRDSVGAAKRAKQRRVAALTVLAEGGEALLRPLRQHTPKPASKSAREKLLVSLLSRGPMNEFGLWCATDGDPGSAGTAYFPAAAMLNHSCAPNVAHQFERTSLVFYAARPIEAGEALCFAYTAPLSPQLQARQKTLRASWCFDCACPRCTAELRSPAAATTSASVAVCVCGQVRLPQRCLRPAGAASDIERLAARWAAAEGKEVGEICCCNVWNMLTREGLRVVVA